MASKPKIVGSGLVSEGFTSLGSGNVAIKAKLLTGTTASTQGGVANVAHGLTGDKIIAFSVKVAQATNQGAGLATLSSIGYEFDISHDSSLFFITNISANSGQILSKPFSILVFYVE